MELNHSVSVIRSLLIGFCFLAGPYSLLLSYACLRTVDYDGYPSFFERTVSLIFKYV